MDKHHILKKQLCKKMGLKADHYYNLIELDHDYHINLIHAPKGNKKGDKAKQELYHMLYTDILQDIKEYKYIISLEELGNILHYYRYCTIEAWSKEYLINNWDHIYNGGKILEELSYVIEEKDGEETYKNIDTRITADDLQKQIEESIKGL